MKKFSDLNIAVASKNFTGDKIKMNKVLNREVEVVAFKIVDSIYTEKGNGKRLDLQLKIKEELHVAWTGSIPLMDQIKQVPEDCFPFSTTIVKENECYKFT